MNATFYVAAVIAALSTVMVITRRNAVHALLYLIVSLLAVAVVFYTLGAPFVAALEVIIYAGAIMVLFVFVIMMLNLGPQAEEQEEQWLSTGMWGGPLIIAGLLLAELIYSLVQGRTQVAGPANSVSPTQVGIALYGPYLLGVELASMVLLAGLIGAYHLGRRDEPEEQEGEKT
jgi:NADH-quinone oxidoreductase subunit J